MLMRAIVLAGVMVILAGAAAASKLSDGSVADMRKLLDLVAPSGEEVGETRFGELAAGQVIDLPFLGDRTLEYYVNAICDDDCVNIDLAILDASGVELDTDDADDNAPVLNIQADEHRSVLDKPKGVPRPMTIEVRMKSCKAETCGYALRITAVE
jgi:hypothetical protein